MIIPTASSIAIARSCTVMTQPSRRAARTAGITLVFNGASYFCLTVTRSRTSSDSRKRKKILFFITGTAPFIDDGLAPSVPTVTPPEKEPAEEEPLPENPEQGEEPTQPETPEVSPDEEPEQGEGTAPEQGEDTPSDGGDVPEDGGSGIEGDLNGDGYLSVFEEYQLAIKNGEPLDIPTYEDEESEEDLTEGEAEEGDME